MKFETPKGTLIYGDCIEEMQQIPDGSVGMVFADLPYGITLAEWDTKLSFPELWKGLARICRDKAALVFTATQPFTSEVVMSKKEWFKYEWVWHKVGRSVGFQVAKYRPMQEHESCLVFCKNGESPIYHPITRARAKKYVYSGKRRVQSKVSPLASCHGPPIELTEYQPTSILSVSVVPGVDIVHQNQKPTELIAYMIETYTEKGETIFDPTCGSASTAIAAMGCDRKFICIESGPEEFAVAKKRIKASLQGFDI